MSRVVISPRSLDVGTAGNFFIAVTNTGAAPLKYVYMHLPAGFSFMGDNIGGGWSSINQPDGTVATGSEIAQGETVSFNIIAQAPGVPVQAAQWQIEVSENADGTDKFAITGTDITDVLVTSALPGAPNVEKLVVAWLQSIVSGEWPVSGDMPIARPDQFITVDRTGGPREAMVLDAAVILVEVYHKTSRSTGSDMANYIADNVQFLPAFAESITGAKVNSLVNLDDVINEFSRYELYLDVYNRR